MALQTARAEPARVLAPAVVVFGIDGAIATGLTELSTDHLGFESLASVAVLAFSALGLTFYAGLLERLVGAVERGEPAPAVHEVLRTLPWGRLLVADGVLWLLTSAGSIAFVVPGLVVATFGVLVGPSISQRGATVPEAFRASVRLVRPNFWLVLLMVTVPLAVENEVVTAVKEWIPHERVVLVYFSHLVLGLVFGTALGLVEVSLAESLLHGVQGPTKNVRSAAAEADNGDVRSRSGE
jgi:hypothetical protein